MCSKVSSASFYFWSTLKLFKEQHKINCNSLTHSLSRMVSGHRALMWHCSDSSTNLLAASIHNLFSLNQKVFNLPHLYLHKRLSVHGQSICSQLSLMSPCCLWKRYKNVNLNCCELYLQCKRSLTDMWIISKYRM